MGLGKGAIGGIITLVIGGTSFAVSKTDIVDNFARETGMSQQEAQQYVENSQKNMVSFSEVGASLTKEGEEINSTSAKLDCANYEYDWESSDLSCSQGKTQLSTIGRNEVELGDCYQALGTDLGSAAKDKISECIEDVDRLNASYELPVATKILDSKTIRDGKNTNSFNKSVLQAALK